MDLPTIIIGGIILMATIIGTMAVDLVITTGVTILIGIHIIIIMLGVIAVFTILIIVIEQRIDITGIATIITPIIETQPTEEELHTIIPIEKAT